MNWTLLAFAALFAGPLLIWRARATPPVHDADQMPGQALWGYFLLLVGAWGVLSLWANPSDLFFLIMLAPAVLALFARLRGYRAKGNERALPSWAAFGYANALVLGLIGVGKTFLVEPMQIPSSSMRPGLVVGDFILVNKLAYGLRIPFVDQPLLRRAGPARGEVVVFRHPKDPRTNLIKRMIGLPGDLVEYRNKHLMVNGVRMDSQPIGQYRYGNEQGQLTQAVLQRESFGKVSHQTLIEPDKPVIDLFQVDHFPYQRQCQYDVSGFRCRVPQGHYLVLGDNRDNSSDGRYWGFVPEGNLAGQAFMVWLSWPGWGHLPIWERMGMRIH
ncbi:signal peptidase I [Chitinimonas sp.]|uniref:signal peptidase I n=1 Tax=Chitinimonas sp. TaxID=1934313 RepID=UPI002F92C249